MPFHMYGKGNVSALINSAQAVVAAYTYDAFGNLLAKTGTLDQPYRFSTKEYNEKTGLAYYGYRFYSPALGRWLTRDPLGERGGINLYGFVQNDPVNLVDPEGEFWVQTIAFGVFIAYTTGVIAPFYINVPRPPRGAPPGSLRPTLPGPLAPDPCPPGGSSRPPIAGQAPPPPRPPVPITPAPIR